MVTTIVKVVTWPVVLIMWPVAMGASTGLRSKRRRHAARLPD
jgi:hypothetical protein